ncbi:MAG: class I SAM-dependent methyltransferase [Candidatus Magasanikbacteria bacterium]|nr:class I SAM-dependent methyltransferase [Candidatus Magasanikbacteria bacterium]
MTFDYNKSIWGKGTATLKWSDPANVRLRRCMNVFSVLSEKAKILEVGCGAGEFIRALKSARPSWNCFGADISETAVNRAIISAGGGVEYALCGEYSLPYSDGEFDGVAIFDVLEHVGDPVVFLQEIRRVLKPSGVLYAFVPCEGDITSLWHLLDKLGQKHELTKRFAGHIHFFSRKQLSQVFENSGFTVESKSYAEHFIGQILGVAVFKAMARHAKNTGEEQLNNEQFFLASNSGWYSIFKKLVNFLISLESALFFLIPSPNVHLAVRNKKKL